MESAEDEKFRIQHEVVRSLFKEYKSYIDEYRKGEAALAATRADPGRIRHDLLTMGESLKDAGLRLNNACSELDSAISATGNGNDDGTIAEARELIANALQQAKEGVSCDHVHSSRGTPKARGRSHGCVVL